MGSMEGEIVPRAKFCTDLFLLFLGSANKELCKHKLLFSALSKIAEGSL